MIKIKKKNLVNDMISHLEDHLHIFKEDGLVGITLNGGLSRGYGDHLSEVDVTLYFDKESYNKYRQGLYDITEGICMIDGLLYDVKILDFEEEEKRSFSVVTELWDMSYAKILYDPNSRVKSLYEEKLKKEVSSEQAGGYMFSSWWHIKLACDIWLHREDSLQGHMMLNEAAKTLVQSIYIVNQEYVPHEKWLLHFLDRLNWLPLEATDLLNILFFTGDLSLASLQQRQEKMLSVYESINNYAGFDLSKKGFIKKIEMVLSKKIYDFNEFDELVGLNTINSDPFNKFVKRVGDTIVVDHEAFMSLSESQMYEWHYSTVTAVQKSL